MPDDDDLVAAAESKSSAAPRMSLLLLCREMEGSAAGRRWWRACDVWLGWPVGRSVRSEAGICDRPGKRLFFLYLSVRGGARRGQHRRRRPALPRRLAAGGAVQPHQRRLVSGLGRPRLAVAWPGGPSGYSSARCPATIAQVTTAACSALQSVSHGRPALRQPPGAGRGGLDQATGPLCGVACGSVRMCRNESIGPSAGHGRSRAGPSGDSIFGPRVDVHSARTKQ